MMLDAAEVKTTERVLEIGTGRGALTKELVRCAESLEGYEIDKESYEALRKELGGTSLVLHNADAFEYSPEFDVLLSSLPYSESSTFVDWLSHRRYDRAVVLLQRDFVTKLIARPGSPAYRAISVIAQASARIEIASDVSRRSFDPQPKVDSCLVVIRWRKTLTTEQTAMIKRIFSQKRRTVRAALKSLGLVAPPSAPDAREDVRLCRVNALRPDSVLAMVNVLAGAQPGRAART